jgi:hypothetical protein
MSCLRLNEVILLGPIRLIHLLPHSSHTHPQMLTNIESKLEEYLTSIDTMPLEFVSDMEKSREKERRKVRRRRRRNKGRGWSKAGAGQSSELCISSKNMMIASERGGLGSQRK